MSPSYFSWRLQSLASRGSWCICAKDRDSRNSFFKCFLFFLPRGTGVFKPKSKRHINTTLYNYHSIFWVITILHKFPSEVLSKKCSANSHRPLVTSALNKEHCWLLLLLLLLLQPKQTPPLPYHLHEGYLQLYTSHKPCFWGIYCCSYSVLKIYGKCNVISHAVNCIIILYYIHCIIIIIIIIIIMYFKFILAS